tara:strand:+ start:5619 stop:6020 length:402 start_codon:yes stop_codon:yes gene_type:complete
MNRRAQTLTAINNVADEGFKWGATDCCQLAATVAKAITGKDFSEGYSYDTSTGALRIIAAHHGIEGIVTKALGTPTESLAELDYGDPVLLSPECGDVIGVWFRSFAYCRFESGQIAKVPHTNVIKGWRLKWAQ